MSARARREAPYSPAMFLAVWAAFWVAGVALFAAVGAVLLGAVWALRLLF